MKTNSTGYNVRTNDTPPEGAQRQAEASQGNLKSYIDGLKKVTNQKTKQRNPNKSQNLSKGQPSALAAPFAQQQPFKQQPKQIMLCDTDMNVGYDAGQLNQLTSPNQTYQRT